MPLTQLERTLLEALRSVTDWYERTNMHSPQTALEFELLMHDCRAVIASAEAPTHERST